MGAWPLILREMRELSRQGQLFWIRVIAGGIAFSTTAFILLNKTFVGREVGFYIFSVLNQILFYTIVVMGPVITADCIAREKREGTLGLLLLAPLSPRDIVVSKFTMNALRAFTLLLAVLPLMALPVVFGGVPLGQIIVWSLRHVVALSIALSAGMLASTLYREFIQAAVVAEIFAVGMLIFCGGLSTTMAIAGWPIGIAVAVGTIHSCAAILKERWEKDSSGYQQPFWVRLFSESDLWREVFDWDTREARSRHPIAWLQEYSWSARLAKWGCCAVVLVVQLGLVFVGLVSSQHYYAGQALLGIGVIAGISLSAANSFRSERLSGAMELLLVTPLTPMKIIGGRLWGIWIHFFPAMAILVFLWIASSPLLKTDPGDAYIAASSYIFIPMVGLCISMFPWHVLVAWGAIFAIGFVVPVYVGHVVLRTFMVSTLTFVMVLQAVIGFASLAILYHRLRTRAFVLS